MNKSNTSIACPNPECNNEILINIQELVAGVQYEGPKCKSTFGLSGESKAVVEKANSEFKKISK